MPTETRAPRRAAMALLPHDVLETADCTAQLSERETRDVALPTHPRVRRRRLAGRVAAKQLALRVGAAGDGVLALDAAAVGHLPDERCREVELLRGPDGRPELRDRGEPLGARVSVSHGERLSCVAMARSAVGIDLETVSPRVAAFARGNLTAAERQWADGAAASGALALDWAHTLLWTLKEAAFKAGLLAVAGAWDFGVVEVDLPPGLPAAFAADRGVAFAERFVGGEAGFASPGRSERAHFETTATPMLILTLVTAIEARP
jgi:4'-phosphopantetheinyl transferase EntD